MKEITQKEYNRDETPWVLHGNGYTLRFDGRVPLRTGEEIVDDMVEVNKKFKEMKLK